MLTSFPPEPPDVAEFFETSCKLQVLHKRTLYLSNNTIKIAIIHKSYKMSTIMSQSPQSLSIPLNHCPFPLFGGTPSPNTLV